MVSIDEMSLNEGKIRVGIENNDNVLESFNHFVDQISAKVDKLERRLNEVEQFYSASTKKSQNNSKASSKKQPQLPSKKQAAAPKKMEELTRHQNKRHKVEDTQTHFDIQLSQDAACAKKARDISNELYEVDLYLKDLREKVVQKCRKMSTEEKRKLGVALTKLAAEDLSKALEIVAQNNPSFQATAEVVELDMDAQSESTLWRLKFFAKDALEVHEKRSVVTSGDTNNQAPTVAPTATTKIDNITSDSSKRKREICEAIFIIKNKKTKHLSGEVQ